MTGATLRVDARAKLTLSLRVLGRRPDGYHEIDALTVSLSAPADALTIIEGPRGVRLAVEGPAAASVPTGPANLVVRAADAMLAAGRARVGVDLTLHKRIPPGAGLGGGSADAAAALVGIRALLGLDVDDRAVAGLAAGLGSDVPFCVRGGAARMRGRGERLEPAAVPALVALVAVPPFGCATPAVYRAWDELGGPTGHAVPTSAGIAAGRSPLVNDLEAAAEHVEPRLRAFREAVGAAAGAPALLAGSGAACAVPFGEVDDAQRAAARVREQVDGLVTVGVTAAAGLRVGP